ncbi:MAG: 50S ribosomal protein L25 [Minisyncoccia bacterium]|jgi:large subunit ribosomal protein L25
MELTVSVRDAKKSSKTLRNKGGMPAVVYGRSEKSTPIAIDRKEFEKIFKAAGESQVISLKGLGVDKDVLIKAVEFDAVLGQPIHADFYAIQKGQTVTVSVPLEFEGTSEAVKAEGGILTKVMHELEVECEPKDLPRAIIVDISLLANLDSQILIKDLQLPSKINISAEPDEVVALISVAEEEPVEVVAPTDLSTIEISEDRGKKEEAEGEAAPAESESKE